MTHSNFHRKIFAGVLVAALSIATLTLTSCSRDGQTLASYTDGQTTSTVTRGEMRKFLSATMGTFDPKKFTVAIQDDLLQNLALVRITSLAARKEKLDQTNDFRRNQIFLDRRSLIAGFDLYLKLHAGDHIYKMFEGQLLFLRKDPGKDRKAEAEDLLKKLNEADDGGVEKIMFASNENNRYRIQGGYLDPYCISCAPNPLAFLTDPVKDKTDRKFALVDTEQGYFLIRTLKVREAKEKDLQKLFLEAGRRAQLAVKKYYAQSGQTTEGDAKKPGVLSDEELKNYAKEQSEAQIRRETRSLLAGEMEGLKANNPVVFVDSKNDGKNPPEVWKTHPAPDAVLFKIGNQEYRYSEFKKEVGDIELSPAEEFMLTNQVILPSELLAKSSLLEKVKKSGEIDYVKEHYTNELLANIYMNRETADVKVLDADIQQYYELRRFNEFQGKSLGQVKEQIRSLLLPEKKQAAFQGIKKKLFETYKVKIEREKLKEGEI